GYAAGESREDGERGNAGSDGSHRVVLLAWGESADREGTTQAIQPGAARQSATPARAPGSTTAEPGAQHQLSVRPAAWRPAVSASGEVTMMTRKPSCRRFPMSSTPAVIPQITPAALHSERTVWIAFSTASMSPS